MEPSSRGRISVDLYGLKAALIERAQVPGVLPSVWVRTILAQALGEPVEHASPVAGPLLHDHQANPHVHISVRVESKHGKGLNPRKADLHRWRETFAEKLRERGVEAEATRQATRGRSRNYEPLWRIKAREDGRLRTSRPTARSGTQAVTTRAEAVEAWMQVGRALATSAEKADQDLARSIAAFVQEMAPVSPTATPRTQTQPTPEPKPMDIDTRR